MAETYYKVLHDDGHCYHGGTGSWPLPNDGQPGAWMPKIDGELRMCEVGYHILRRGHFVEWLGPAIFEVEPQGEVLHDTNKSLCRSARLVRRLDWDRRKLTLFAADCAERVLGHFEAKFPNDQRARNAIAAARDCANGKISTDAYAAAAADRKAEREWQTERLFQYLEGKVQ